MVNLITVHQKETIYIIKSDGPVSLLPTFDKVFERVSYNSIFHWFYSNGLFNKCQSGFFPGDYYIYINYIQ